MTKLYKKLFQSLMIVSTIKFGVVDAKAETFIKGGYGISISDRLNDYGKDGYVPASKPKNSWIYDVSVGYKLNNNILLDLGYKKFSKFKYSAIDPSKYSYKQDISSDAYTINAQYNFDNNSKIFPFLRMGIGISKNKLGKYNVINLDDNSKKYTLDSNKSNNFTFNIGAGLGYKINEKFSADFRYEYTDLGKIKNSSKVLENTIQENIESPVSSLKANSFHIGFSYYFN